jgi:hypothetical protein
LPQTSQKRRIKRLRSEFFSVSLFRIALPMAECWHTRGRDD